MLDGLWTQYHLVEAVFKVLKEQQDLPESSELLD